MRFNAVVSRSGRDERGGRLTEGHSLVAGGERRGTLRKRRVQVTKTRVH